ncbi:MAG: hypothetical protein U0935_01910 [Pirellulales bacterium]
MFRGRQPRRRSENHRQRYTSSVLKERDPAKLPWGDLKVDVAAQSTGVFTGKKNAEKRKPGYDGHLDAGARRVVLSGSGEGHAGPDRRHGVNDHLLKPR